jgi:hypothetical protein
MDQAKIALMGHLDDPERQLLGRHGSTSPSECWVEKSKVCSVARNTVRPLRRAMDPW